MSGTRTRALERWKIYECCLAMTTCTSADIAAQVSPAAARLIGKLCMRGYLVNQGGPRPPARYAVTAKGQADMITARAQAQTIQAAAASGTPIRGTRGPVRGPCPTCGVYFHSAHKKDFCTLKCLTQSPAFRARIVEQSHKALTILHGRRDYSALERLQRQCLECGQVFFAKPSEKNRKYCQSTCYRQYMAKRFDRWMANPQSLALPQCYDEFLLTDELPCLIAGCDWHGQALGFHVNRAHGITARDFKKLAGFNLKTGLVTPALAALMSRLKKLNPYWAVHLIPNTGGTWPRGTTDPYQSLEGQEHATKARILLSDLTSERPPAPCRHCGTLLDQPYFGRRLYCDVPCRTRWYTRPRAQYECVCDFCGGVFVARPGQWKRFLARQPVCCSLTCRNVRNIIIALTATGKSLPRTHEPPHDDHRTAP